MEKERYELNDNDFLFDNDNNIAICDFCDLALFPDIVVDLLNQQDARIKELEEELDDAKRDYIPKLEFGLQRANKMGRDAEEENQQLKEQLSDYKDICHKHHIDCPANLDRVFIGMEQQLHDLPKNIVEEIRIAIFEECREYFNAEDDGVIQYTEITPKKCNKILDAILKKFGGENERTTQEGLLQKQFDKDMEIQELKDEIEQLKQSQKQLAVEELRRIKEYILINDKYDEEAGCNIIKTFDLIEDIIDRIEKLGGGENE